RIGDTIFVNRDEWRMEFEVTGLSGKRGPAPIAATLYKESQASIERRELDRQGRRVERAAAPPTRPDKKDRRLLRRLMRRD
ncbi:MAG: RNA-binding protein, partial [Gammaproteobacteria bacterium]|nr:RNA-binding protein [Gammaproteobacteria bacterium]